MSWILILLLSLSCMIDPSNKLVGSKDILFILTILSCMYKLMLKPLDKKLFSYLLFIITIMIPLGIFMGIVNDGLLSNAILNIKALLFSVILLVYACDKKKFLNAFLYAIFIYEVFYLFIIFCMATPLGGHVSLLLMKSENALIGLRRYGSFLLPMVFIKSSPLLLFPLGIGLFFYFEKGRKLWAFLSLGALICLLYSGTRANIFSAIIIFVLAVYYYRVPRKLRFLIISFAIVFVLPFITKMMFNTFLIKGELSIDVKTKHLLSYIALFKQSPSILLLGCGFGQAFYTTGINEYVYNTELSYLEMIRIWGVPVTIVFLGVPFYSAYAQYVHKGSSLLAITAVLYLLVAGTNPLLISSTGFLAITVIFAITKDRDETLGTAI